MMNRRKLFQMLPLAGAAIPASQLFPEASTLHEVKPEKRYLIHTPHPISPEAVARFRQQLDAAGLTNVNVLSGPFEIYELEA